VVGTGHEGDDMPAPSRRLRRAALGLAVAGTPLGVLAAGAAAANPELPDFSTARFAKITAAGERLGFELQAGTLVRVLRPSYGRLVVIRGRLAFRPSGAGLSGATVLLREPAGPFATSVATGGGGRFVLRWRPTQSGRYTLVALGQSPPAVPFDIRLRPRLTLAKTRIHVVPGAHALVRGKVLPPGLGAGRRVRLLRPVPGGWRTVANGTVARDGGFAVRYRPRVRAGTVLRLRVVAPPQDGSRSSSTDRVPVRIVVG
jgi:hypothetical protein